MNTDKWIELASKAWNESDKTTSRDYLLKAWDSLIEPKEEQVESYHVCRYLIKIFTELDDLDSALRWADQIQACDLDRLDSGDREFIKGKVLFEMGNINEAKILFEKANKMSTGRCFQDEDKKYKKLLSGLEEKELTNSQMISKADKEYLNKNYKESLNLLFDCLNHEKNLDNGFLYLRKGQCHFELDDQDKSADALTRAYMLKGERIFKKEHPKYFDFLKSRIEIERKPEEKNLLKRLFKK